MGPVHHFTLLFGCARRASNFDPPTMLASLERLFYPFEHSPHPMTRLFPDPAHSDVQTDLSGAPLRFQFEARWLADSPITNR